MLDLIRARHIDTGIETHITQSMYDFSPDNYQLLDEEESEKSAGRKRGSQADTEKGTE